MPFYATEKIIQTSNIIYLLFKFFPIRPPPVVPGSRGVPVHKVSQNGRFCFSKFYPMTAIALQTVSLDLPKTDISFFMELVRKMGWAVRAQTPLDAYIASRPKGVALADEDIAQELAAVRYAK
jgi:hypothetical protein